MSFPCIRTARSFRPERHLPFLIGDERLGWIGAEDVSLLAAWPEVFKLSAAAVELSPDLDSVDSRNSALERVIRSVAESGRIRGWRNELYAVRRSLEEPPLALIERAAAYFFGILTFGVHLNGIVHGADGVPRLWISRRSPSKPIDPGLFDNLVGGGIGWNHGVFETLVKECWEESGIPRQLACLATPGRTLHQLTRRAEGVKRETIFVYDLLLPADFRPAAQDGEVSEHRLIGIAEVLALISAGEMTVDACLVSVDWLLRSGRIDPGAPELEGFEALLRDDGI
jgi:8-oxo-dGTP pyrophosphatase MutT (NUDIX family)